MAIEDVIYEHMGIDNEDDRRALLTAFNGDLGDFVARQAKIAVIKKDSVLGEHYHDYRELFYILNGEVTFELLDINSKERREYHISKGDRLLIPPRVAHRAFAKKDTTLMGYTEQPYISPEHNDHIYNFE